MKRISVCGTSLQDTVDAPNVFKILRFWNALMYLAFSVFVAFARPLMIMISPVELNNRGGSVLFLAPFVHREEQLVGTAYRMVQGLPPVPSASHG
jgi:hypothetical protein